jgi:demethylmenaquinone methyltransferase / 2-methoxy-6-polyprenyl-1,4-benzoquinol methylase
MVDSLPTGPAKREAVRTMFDAIAPRYERANRVMTFGLDRRWRRRTVDALDLAPGSLVVDVAAGTGDLCRELEERGCRPVGVDLSLGMLAAARTSAPLVQADALRLPFDDGSAAGATCGFALRNLVALGPFLAELARVVRPGGRIALLEVAEPSSPLLRRGHAAWFGAVVPRLGALVSDGPFRRGPGAAAYRYLPRSFAYLPPPMELVSLLRSAGFGDADRRPLSAGITQLLVGTRDAD